MVASSKHPKEQHKAYDANPEFIVNTFPPIEFLSNLQNNTKCHFLKLAVFSQVACCIMHQTEKCASHGKYRCTSFLHHHTLFSSFETIIKLL